MGPPKEAGLEGGRDRSGCLVGGRINSTGLGRIPEEVTGYRM